MWVLTTRGFYSVVEHFDDPDRLLVRARVREDLEALAPLIEGLEVRETADADYRFRAEVSRGAWAEAVAALADEIDYPNFKNAVRERQGSERASVYSSVWATLSGLQDDAA